MIDLTLSEYHEARKTALHAKHYLGDLYSALDKNSVDAYNLMLDAVCTAYENKPQTFKMNIYRVEVYNRGVYASAFIKADSNLEACMAIYNQCKLGTVYCPRPIARIAYDFEVD